MEKFRIKDKQSIIQVDVYEIEANSAEEALDLYVNKLSGSIEPTDSYTTSDEEEGIEIA